MMDEVKKEAHDMNIVEREAAEILKVWPCLLLILCSHINLCEYLIRNLWSFKRFLINFLFLVDVQIEIAGNNQTKWRRNSEVCSWTHCHNWLGVKIQRVCAVKDCRNEERCLRYCSYVIRYSQRFLAIPVQFSVWFKPALRVNSSQQLQSTPVGCRTRAD